MCSRRSPPTALAMVAWYTVLATVSGCRGVPAAAPPRAGAEVWRLSDPAVRVANRGVALMERYAYAEAVAAFEEALALAPRSADLRVNLAIATYNRSAKGDLEQAEKLLDEVLREEPDHARAWYFRGITHQYAGRDERAVACFERVVGLAPHDACAWYLLARSKAHLGQPCQAELERAVAENPALVSAYYDLMRLAAQEGRQEEAQGYQEKFVQLRESPLAEMVVMPNYRQMGPLAVVQPLTAAAARKVTSGELSAGTPRTLLRGVAPAWQKGTGTSPRCLRGPEKPVRLGASPLSPRPVMAKVCPYSSGPAVADVNGDGRLDLALVVPGEKDQRRVVLLLGRPDGSFAEASESSGLEMVRTAGSLAFGDYDNDGKVDLFLGCAGPNHLFRGRGDGTFEDVTAKTNTGGSDVDTCSAVFLDADHDGDLDLYVCNMASPDGTSPAANQLLNNNADGTFSDIAAEAGIACPGERSIAVAPADLDGDRDTDLVVLNAGSPAKVFFNDRFGKYHEGQMSAEPIQGDSGGVVQDFNGDGRPDLLVLPGPGTTGRLYLSDDSATWKPSPQFDGCLKALTTWGDFRAARVADVDLDGDLDVVLLCRGGHVLLNDGEGRFVAKPNVWPTVFTEETIDADLVDLTGDGVPDLLRVLATAGGMVELVPTKLTPPANWLAVMPTGDRGADKRTRSPASGFGTRMELRCGVHSQVVTYTGLTGGRSQSQQPWVFGLNAATKADYLALTWPDGVTQSEIELAAGTHHRISETERRTSSCPVLFAWNGTHFGYVGDFAGVGGLGYFVAPNVYAAPQVLEQVKLGAEQLVARDGLYELRVCEPMEEVAYVDRLELLAVDHPEGLEVYPDERLAFTGPPPTHRLLCPVQPIFPVRAQGPDGAECADRLTEVDRVYAYQPPLDRRFHGFCAPHALVLDFGNPLTRGPSVAPPGSSSYLFVTGWIEYPYSQTTYAAAQAGVTWQPMKIERQTEDGRWETIVPDAGAPGGAARTIAIDLTGKLPPGNCILRLSTNLEIYFDQAFIAADRGTEGFVTRSVPWVGADLRRLGFPMEYSPDGRHPSIYTYDVIEPTSSFKMPRGAYTRYGPVESLLREGDDRYVILGTGDEIAVSFDARALPPPAAGQVRSFVLVSHAYCKDMDLYTAEPDTVEPLPFRHMSSYPYPPGEHFPDAEESQRCREQFNTRWQP